MKLIKFSHLLLTFSIIFSISIFLVLFQETNTVYAQNNEGFQIWKNESVCENAEKILSKQNKSFEQLTWISKDVKERESFVSSLTPKEIDMILTCAKNTLPNLKSEIISKKIGFFEGENGHQVNGIAKIITIKNKDYLRFENFEIGFSGDTNPDLHVYLTMNDDFSNSLYLEKLKTKVGSKNYPLQNIDIDDFDTVIIYDEISQEIFSTIHLSNPLFFIDSIRDVYNNLKNNVEHPKIVSQIIYKKTGILQGSDDFQAFGRIETPYEEDQAELKFNKFEISKGYDFHLYATEDGFVKKSADWTFGPNNFVYVSNSNTNEILRYDATTGSFVDIFVTSNNNGGLQGPKDLVFSPDGNYLYVSSFITNEILRYDGNSGQFIGKFVSTYNGDVSNPKYMIFGSDRNLYVSSVNTDQILRFNGTSGKLLDVFIDRNTGGLKSPKGLTFGPYGDLFVSNGEDSSVLRFFNNGTSRGIFVEQNPYLNFEAKNLLITNTTNQINSINNTTPFDDISLLNIPGLVNPEDVVFFPNCQNNKDSQIQKNTISTNDLVIDDQCYFLVSSSNNNLIFRYIYNESTESSFKDVFVNDEKIKNPQAISFGPDKNFYVSSFDTDEILRFDGITGKFIDVFASSGGLDGPTGMLFDENTSSLFVSSKNSNQIFQYDSRTGDFIQIFIQDNNEIMKKPESIIKGPDNNLYVSSSETNKILQYDINDGNLLGQFVADKSGGLYRPKDLSFNHDGNLCVNSIVSNDIKCYSVDDGKLLNKIDIAFNRGLIGKPYSEFGPDGELYVSDTLLSTISRYDRNTNLYSSKVLSGEDELLQGPRNLVFGLDNNLYVTSNNNNQIVRLDGETGLFIDAFVTHSSGGLAAPQDLVFNDGYLYVTSNDNHRVLRYDQVTGNFIDDFIKSRDGGLTSPRGLVFDGNGHLYVASNENHKILQYNGITGVFEKELDTGNELLNPVGLAIDEKGNLLVSSFGNDQIISYDIVSPNLKYTILISDEFIDNPTQLALDSENGSLYVSSSNNNRILKYDFKNGKINEIKELTNMGSLERPYGLTIKNEELFVSNVESNRILKYNVESKESELFHSESLGVLGPLGLTFGPDGNVYVISGKNYEIFRYDPNNGNLLGTFSLPPFVDVKNKPSLPDGQFQDLVFSPDEKYLYVTSMYTGQILRFDGLTGKYLDVFIDLKKDGLKHPQNIIYSPDKKLFYINSFDTGSIFAYDVETGRLVKDGFNENTILNLKNMKFGPDGRLYLTVDDYTRVFRLDTSSGNIEEFDLGGIYLGSLDDNLLKTKYLLNNINTTRYDTIVVYDDMLERPFATISLQDDLIGDFLPIPVMWNMVVGSIGNVAEPAFTSKPIEKQAGYFNGLNNIPTIGQVTVAKTENSAIVTLETFEIRYDNNQYASFSSDVGITTGPKVIACLTDGTESTCRDEQNSIVLGPMLPNVGDQIYKIDNINLEKFDTILLYDTLLNQQFTEISLRDDKILRVSPQLFVDWAQYQFPAFPLLLLGFIAFPLTFDYVRTIFKILFLSLYFSRKKKRRKLPSISTNKKITIMIPAHNEESGIKASIQAALKTNYKNKEIIVIDDKSTDKTYEIAKEFSDKGLIKLLHREQASGSKASALNYGFAYATGDLILCMDGDTLLDVNSLQHAVAYFDDKEVKAVSGNVKILSGDDGVVNTLTKAQTYEYLIAIELGRSYTSILNILLVISGAFGVFRRDIFSGTGKFDKDTITEDFDLTLKVRKTKGKIPFVRDSIARTYCPNNWKAWIKQRQRWAHGQMQTLKKHKDLMTSSKFTRRDRISMFDMWILDIAMNFLFVIYLIALGPAAIIMAVYGNVHILVNILTLVIFTYLISETIIFIFAVLVSRKYKYFKYIYLVPFMALFYRPFLKIVIFKSYINAARSKEAKW